MILASCTNELDWMQETRQMTFSATIENGQPATKTALGPKEGGIYKTYWSENDKLDVFCNGQGPFGFSLTEGVGTSYGKFAGQGGGNSFLALYPSGLGASVNGKELSFNLPQTQQYAEGSFGDGAFPMIAVGNGSDFDFRNLCSVIRFSIRGSYTVTSLTFTPNDENIKVSGGASICIDFNDVPQLVMKEYADNQVKLECCGIQLSKTTAKDFFIVIPAQEYKGGFTLKVNTNDINSPVIKKSSTKDFTAQRSLLYSVQTFDLDNEQETGDWEDIVPPNDEIWYVTSNGRITDFGTADPFDVNIISHKYNNGKGIIKCDGPIKELKNDAFEYRTAITEIYLPNCVEKIENYALVGTNVSSLRLPDKLKELGYYALKSQNFESFSGKIVSEDGRCVIMDGTLIAFAPAGLTKYEIPVGVKRLGSDSFSNCPELRGITFNEGLESIGPECFSHTPLDCDIVFPQSLVSIDYYAFLGCAGIKGFYGNDNFHTSDNRCMVYYSNGHKLIGCFAGKEIDDYVIPEGVEGAEHYAFYELPNLRSLTFPSSFNYYIGYEAIYRCQNLEAVYGNCTTEDHKGIKFGDQFTLLAVKNGVKEYNVQEGITSIGYGAFANSPDLETISMSDDVIELGGYDFYSCIKLKKVVLSARLERINRYNPFLRSTNLEEVYFRSLIPPSYNDTQFYEMPNLKMYVPRQSLEQYQNSPDWAQFKKYFVPYDYDDLPDTPVHDWYESTDYSADGTVIELQKATKGNGIDIVLMGDAYSDRLLADGTYDATMRKVMDVFFTQEPYKTFRDYFNVYDVRAVSKNEVYESGARTALGTGFGEGTYTYGNDNSCFNYAQKALSDNRMDNALIITICNIERYAGTCFMYYSGYQNDYGVGAAVAYFPLGTDEEMFAGLIHHEAGGHGFSKLLDEYAYEDYGAIPQNEKKNIIEQFGYGWGKNIDFTGNPDDVKWCKFLSDERYKYDGLGVFEGGATYWTGVWRPTEYSLMRYNTGNFNAPSREAIYYRIHKLAYGADWQYDYKDFVKYDAINRATGSMSSTFRLGVSKLPEPTAPPVVVGKTWREALEEAPSAQKTDAPASSSKRQYNRSIVVENFSNGKK